MFKEEKYLNDRLGKVNTFKVPEGYFENFPDKMMSKLTAEDELISWTAISAMPERKKLVRLRRWIGGVAAGLFVASFSLGMFLHTASKDVKPTQNHPSQVVASQSHNDYSIDAFVDYSMMDTEDMYAYMADN